jgi:hypothetical protein
MLIALMVRSLIPVVLVVLVSCTFARSEGVYIPGENEEVGELTVLDDEQVCVQADYDVSPEDICYDVVDGTQVDPSLELGDEAQVNHERGVAIAVETFEGP